MAITPTMEQMAIAVLRGDEAAARALADEVVGMCAEGGLHLPPVQRLSVDAGRVRVVLLPHPQGMSFDEADIGHLNDGIRSWLAGDVQAVALPPGCRIELYEMPEAVPDGGPPPDGPPLEPHLCCRCGGEVLGDDEEWIAPPPPGLAVLCDDCWQQAEKESAAGGGLDAGAAPPG